MLYCQEMLPKVSRTFALAIDRLPQELYEDTSISYLLCRIPDTIEDAKTIPAQEKSDILGQYAQILQDSAPGQIETFVRQASAYREDNAYWDIVDNTDRVLAALDQLDSEVEQSAREHTLELVNGMKTMVDRHPDGIRIEDMDEFSEYCYYVAGTVGNLVTDVFSYECDLDEDTTGKLQDDAESFGEALQTVNIVKDVYEDYHQENAVYVPQSVLESKGATHQDLIDILEGRDGPRAETMQGIEELIGHADTHLGQANQYIAHLQSADDAVRESVMLPHLLAVGTLREARNTPENILTETPVKISRKEVFGIMNEIKDIPDQTSFEATVERAEAEEILPGMIDTIKFRLYSTLSR